MVPEFVTKIIQIFDCKVARHGNMIVGKTGAGKSVAWQTLQRAMGRLRKNNHESEHFQKVQQTAGMLLDFTLRTNTCKLALMCSTLHAVHFDSLA